MLKNNLQKPVELRPQTGGLSLRDLSTNGVGLRCGRNDTMAKVGTLDADIGYPQNATWSFVLSDASFGEIIVTFFDLVDIAYHDLFRTTSYFHYLSMA